jgi:DNA polymerase III alpha subunit
MTALLEYDLYGRQIYSHDDAVNALYINPNLDLRSLDIRDVEQFNRASALLYTGTKLESAETPECTPEEYHKMNQQNWHMPVEYKDIDIAKWCLDRCENDEQRQRVGTELLMYQERDLFSLLQFLCYMVDKMREHNIVWGVGRGSSVASYVLYLIGVHKIDSLYYDLDVAEFLR